MSNIVLLGVKGVGKTTVGELLAKRLRRPFYDTDHIIEERFGQSCRALHEQLGDTEFRACEREALATLEPTENSVIATGGGTYLHSLRSLQALGQLVVLSIDAKTFAKRPFPKTTSLEIDNYFTKRDNVLKRLNALKISVVGKTPCQIVNNLIKGIKHG